MQRSTVIGSGGNDNSFFVWTPDANSGPRGSDANCELSECGLAEATFSCSGPSKLKFDFNLIAATGQTDSLYLQVDSGELMTWNIPRTSTIDESACTGIGGILDQYGTACMPSDCGTPDTWPRGDTCQDISASLSTIADYQALPSSLNTRVCCNWAILNSADDCLVSGTLPCVFRDPWQWRESHAVFDVDAGPHTLKIITREDGTQIRDMRLNLRGTCGFAYEVALPETELATVGSLIPPMAQEDDFVFVPNGAADRADGSVEFAMICGSADVIQFSFEVSAPNGNDDRYITIFPIYYCCWLLTADC